ARARGKPGGRNRLQPRRPGATMPAVPWGHARGGSDRRRAMGSAFVVEALLPGVGGLELLVFLVILTAYVASLGLRGWCLVYSAGRRETDWKAAGEDKGTWVLILVLGTLFCGPIGLVIDSYYLAVIRHRLIERSGRSLD